MLVTRVVIVILQQVIEWYQEEKVQRALLVNWNVRGKHLDEIFLPTGDMVYIYVKFDDEGELSQFVYSVTVAVDVVVASCIVKTHNY